MFLLIYHLLDLKLIGIVDLIYFLRFLFLQNILAQSLLFCAFNYFFIFNSFFATKYLFPFFSSYISCACCFASIIILAASLSALRICSFFSSDNVSFFCSSEIDFSLSISLSIVNSGHPIIIFPYH